MRPTRGNARPIVAEPTLAVLDTSVIIDPPDDFSRYVDAVCVTAVSIGEMAFGLHTSDPLIASQRERLYRETLEDYDPVPYDAAAAHEYGAIAAAVRAIGRNPRPRQADLLIAAIARHLGAKVLTRNVDDFVGLDDIVSVVGI